ncbi:hypothetical protein [Pseudomonas alvandae]|jgi:hypothetical protein|uniref:Uncharacterized protein n=1 Tax=Pseudomonas canavaninivorans TaxID=2842348 RepID=A0ABX8QFA1_PSECO|nr:hypothetical protein [Pseudomonas alvandae]QXI54030.1 hypothetical protein KSS97_03480 [Pseudomonas alvandae]
MRSEQETNFLLVAGGGIFLLGAVFFVGQIYLVFFRKDEVFGALHSSSGLRRRRTAVGEGVLGDYFTMLSVGAFLLFPERAIKQGELSREDFIYFPKSLLRVVRFLYSVGLVGAVFLLGVGVVGVVAGWLK